MDIKTKDDFISRVAGIVSGLLLAIPNLFSTFAPLQLLAFIPILIIGTNGKKRPSTLLMAGMYMGLAYTLPQMFILKLPISLTLILIVYLTIFMIIFAWTSSQLLRSRPVLGAFAVGALLVVLDWTNFTMLPIWGTAQSIVRPWSAYPALIQFVSLTGITGIIFILGTLQALLVSSINHPKLRKKLSIVTAFVILVFAAANMIINSQKTSSNLKVAAIGWAYSDSVDEQYVQTSQGFEALFVEPVKRAAANGAKLVVSPELAFYIDNFNRDKWTERFQAISKRYNILLAIGYFDISAEENRLMFITPDGRDLPEYVKTNLTPFEDYRKGTGELRIIDFEGIRLGGMICHDDNFTRLSREYGREQVSVVAVPTLDWSTVKNAHLQGSIHRAIESRYAVVRAAANGISTIISPTGVILARCDHFSKGPAVIMAQVPIYKSRTFFSIAGHWPVVLSFIFLLIYIGWNLQVPWRKIFFVIKLPNRKNNANQ